MKLKNLFNNVFGEVVEEEGLGNNVLNTDAASEVELEPESQQEEVKSLPQQDEVQPQPQPEEEPQPQPKKKKKEKPVETAKPEDRTMFELLRNDIRFQISEVLNALMSLKLEMKAKDEEFYVENPHYDEECFYKACRKNKVNINTKEGVARLQLIAKENDIEGTKEELVEKYKLGKQLVRTAEREKERLEEEERLSQLRKKEKEVEYTVYSHT